jgi:Na+/melibiose symporter-like transporter
MAAMVQYKLTEERFQQIVRDVAQRRAGAAHAR